MGEDLVEEKKWDSKPQMNVLTFDKTRDASPTLTADNKVGSVGVNTGG